MGETGNVKFVTWNCRGLGSIKKIKQVMDRIKQLQAQIVFLQETHMVKSETIRIRRRWQGQVFAACHTSNARGVMTLIHKSIPIQVQKVTKDTLGRYMVLQCTFFQKR